MIVELAATAVAILLALAAPTAGAALFLRLARRDGGPANALCAIALLAGLAAGAALLLAAPDRAAFEPGGMFGAHPAWRSGLATVWDLALPGIETLYAVLAALGGNGAPALAALSWLALAILGVGLGTILRAHDGVAQLRMALAVVALAALTAVASRYATHLLAWGLAQLGFWVFLAALVLLQRWRHRTAH